MKLSSVLLRENNNLDLFRLLAAGMVIYRHAYGLVSQGGQKDLVERMLVFDTAGSLAVKVFFFLSGLVVANSLLQKRDPVDFLVARAFRVWPALIFVVLSTILFIGPLVTDLSLGEYFSSPQIYFYFFENIRLDTVYGLPGVFANLPHPLVVNGSLWTLQYEVAAYLTLLALFMLGVFKSRLLVVLIFLVVALDPLTGNKLLFTWRASNPHIDFLAPCFGMGVLAAVFKEDIALTFRVVVSLLVLYLLFQTSILGPYLFYALIFSSMLYLSAQSWMIKFKPGADVSYGVYLWGFPIQQTMIYFFPHEGILFNLISSLVLALGFGWLSWTLVEKRGILFGQRLISSNLFRGGMVKP
ncbi:Peptidoglycan/LPS O-acetylase OafA/YrhL, contains acyltransferase and SGNH-hydrolase domains [Polaromonas sp. YR568]|uniref:acyltransferase family protein n=1 Tax=Polaromonas sp. YR568 TaxID=1855301 RepID=UPI0008E99C63|nr:acyltransferase [Polaromonas sp. YR568]SFU60842.1 Peptidoglycan/LPS O-acetylase OafA/YrhL, contains acyltransferase and SGNH-hydrolase domains [Polaromonas sp. YR568]